MIHETPRSSRQLADLLHHRWAVPVMATMMDHGGGAKFVTVQRALGASRGSVRRALDGLIGAGLALRNPGYGHPMRPEYILTGDGKALAPAAAGLWRKLIRLGLAEVGLKKWSLPVTVALARVPGRFNRLREALPAATPRALAAALRDLQESGLIERFLVDDDPPRTEYQVTRRGKSLAATAMELSHALSRAPD
jgi:DNA-binding HxlR family transcriptional regulator